jgi:hypothetical protein
MLWTKKGALFWRDFTKPFGCGRDGEDRKDEGEKKRIFTSQPIPQHTSTPSPFIPISKDAIPEDVDSRRAQDKHRLLEIGRYFSSKNTMCMTLYKSTFHFLCIHVCIIYMRKKKRKERENKEGHESKSNVTMDLEKKFARSALHDAGQGVCLIRCDAAEGRESFEKRAFGCLSFFLSFGRLGK